VLIVASAIGFDFGSQASLIAHQTIVYGIDPPARSRLNALLFTCLSSAWLGRCAGQPGARAVGLARRRGLLDWRERAALIARLCMDRPAIDSDDDLIAHRSRALLISKDGRTGLSLYTPRGPEVHQINHLYGAGLRRSGRRNL